MPSRPHLFTFFFVLAFILCAGCTDAPKPHRVPVLNAADLKNTTVAPVLEQEALPGHSTLYCATFQMAWDRLRDDVIKEPVEMTRPPEWLDAINLARISKNDLTPGCYVSMAGYGKDGILPRLNETLKKRFGADAPVVRAMLRPNDILAYAFLLKKLPFKTKFEPFKDPFTFHTSSGDAEVSSFGYKPGPGHKPKLRDMLEQVTIMHYGSNSDFILKLTPEDDNDELILARFPDPTSKVDVKDGALIEPVDDANDQDHHKKTSPRATLATWLELARSRIRESRLKPSERRMNEDERLQVPNFAFDITHDYDDLIGRTVTNRILGPVRYVFTLARQRIRFELNETGAKLKSDSIITLKGAIRKEPRAFIFEGPFLLYLKQKNTETPYLVVWVDSTDLLVKTTK